MLPNLNPRQTLLSCGADEIHLNSTQSVADAAVCGFGCNQLASNDGGETFSNGETDHSAEVVSSLHVIMRPIHSAAALI